MFRALLDWYREWRADRIREKYAKQFLAGYRYAVECFRSNMDRPEIHLRNLVQTARAFNDYSEFDRGIERALSVYGWW